ncbi:hypothetical protein [Halomicrococcus sp. SG-WS-1]|uniref:hypothetical protein n=1 Tax=Halomicrococcus sp. SG-WS-1 TaxID=3439057 RepID=UPI003F7A24F7
MSPLSSVTTFESTRLWGRPDDRRRHWRRFVGGFAALVLALLLVVLVGKRFPGARGLVSLVYDAVLPAVLFCAPPVVSAVSAYSDGGVFASLAVGVVPGALFSVVLGLMRIATGQSTGEAPLWALALAFVGIGVAGAVVGYGVGRGLCRLAERRSA